MSTHRRGSRSQELAKMSDEILKEPKPREEPKEIHLDEKDEKEDASGRNWSKVLIIFIFYL